MTRFVVGLVALFSLLSVVILWVLAIAPALVLGWERVAITSDSMAPRINRGDVIVIEPFDDRRLGAGTVVVFYDRARGDPVTHRIMAVNDDGTYVTRGDGNQVRDSTPLSSDRIEGVGRLLAPRAGMAAIWAREEAWGALAAFVSFIVVSGWAVRFAIYDRFDPWLDSSVHHSPGRRLGRGRAWATPVALVALTTATTLSTSAITGSDAAFTSAENTASFFEAGRW